MFDNRTILRSVVHRCCSKKASYREVVGHVDA